MTDTQEVGTSTRPWLPLWVGLAAAAAIIGVDFLSKPIDLNLTREHGGVELASACLYLWAAAIWITMHDFQGLLHKWQIPAVLLMMGGREFDLDKSLTSVGLLKASLYLTTQAPIWERLFGVAVLALTITVLVRLARHQGSGFLARLRSGAAVEVAVVAGLLLAVFAKTIDGLGRKLLSFGIELDATSADWFGGAEEVIELFVPFLFLTAVLKDTRRRH